METTVRDGLDYTAASSQTLHWPSGLTITRARLEWFDRLATVPPGLDLGRLARTFGFRRSTVHKWVHVFGYGLHDPRRRAGPAHVWEAVNWLETDSQIARTLQVSRERVRQVRKDRGLVRSARSPKNLAPPFPQGQPRRRKSG